jgi:hypothetical protein
MFVSSQVMAKDQNLGLDLTFDHYLAGLKYLFLSLFLLYENQNLIFQVKLVDA